MPGGRPRKPDEVHILEGTFRPDRHGDPSASVVADGEPTPPRHLKGEALAFWKDTVPGLVTRKVAAACDSAALACMCDWWARHRKYCRALDRMKSTDRRLYQMTILAGIAWSNFDKIACRFGLTPGDRTKLRTPANEGKPPRVMARKRG